MDSLVSFILHHDSLQFGLTTFEETGPMLCELIWAYYNNVIHHFSQYFCSYNFLLPFFRYDDSFFLRNTGN